MDKSAWDEALAGLNGHPLQSVLWGDARTIVDRIPNLRWAAVDRGGRCVFMARVETRTVLGFGKIAWIPRGPATVANSQAATIHGEFLRRLRGEGFMLCIDDPYPGRRSGVLGGTALVPRPRTILVDLTVGQVRLMANLHAQWRAGVRAAARAGVVVQPSRSPEDISRFYAKCNALSQAKGFELPGSEALMLELCKAEPGRETEAVLMLASYEGRIAAGALALRCGRSVHYMWGATDRAFARQRPGEAVQWALIEWALAKECETYDLEGIVPNPNSGVYAFKRRMGGVEVELPGKQAYSLTAPGAVALRVGRWLGRL